MPGITDPTEEYFKDGLWAWVTDQWKKLIGDDAGHLQVDVVESGLPSGAATSANQATMITALQLIDDLRAALSSVATDELDVVIDGQTADVEIKQTAAADLTPGVCGWDGSAWRKLPLLFGYSDRYYEDLGGTQSGDGTYNKAGTTVPAGEIWVIQALTIRNTSGARGSVQLRLYAGASPLIIAYDPSPIRHVPLLVTGAFVLREGDKVYVRLATCLDGDTLDGGAWGYKMKVAE